MRGKFGKSRLIAMALVLGLGCGAYAERHPELPPPYATPSASRFSKVIGWPAGQMPRAPAGFVVSLFASLDSPRALYVLPSGDVLVAQASRSHVANGAKSPNQIALLKINSRKTATAQTFATGLDDPFGMALWGNEFFVAEPTRVLRFNYENGRLAGKGKVIATLPFPLPQRHWTRHLLLSPEGRKLYVAVGSASNWGEAPDPLDPRNAAILEMNRDGSEQKIFASGLRNPVSLAWEPTTGDLWATVNERDELGDNLVPDYITHVVRDGFYGWPYSYWGSHEDPRRKGERPDLVAKAIVPDFSMGNHTAALGITFTSGTQIPAPFNQGALVVEHGSWNRSILSGYKVSYVPFVTGQPVDGERDFLTGFIADESTATVYGRPVSAVVLADGSVLVSDDGAGKIWRVSAVRPATP